MILASGSPRRQQLLQDLGLEFRVVVREVAEPLPDGLSPIAAAETLAQLKSAAYTDLAAENVVITADTIVALNGQLLAKPKDREDAIGMLNALSGAENQVISAVCLRYRNKVETFHARTIVRFRPLESWEIAHYVDRFQPYDKAGAYGIQEWIGMIGITHIEGDYYNVVGMPAPLLWTALKNFLPGMLILNE